MQANGPVCVVRVGGQQAPQQRPGRSQRFLDVRTAVSFNELTDVTFAPGSGGHTPAIHFLQETRRGDTEP